MQDPYAAFSDPVAPAQSRPQARPQAPRRAPAQRPRVQFSDDRDAAIRTIIGEADGQPEIGMQAVAGVIRNRAQSRGQSIRDVVTAPYQFEPWGKPESAQRLMSIQPNDPRYVRAAQVYDSGVDPTNGADHFYAPGLQADLGRAKPSFDNGTGRQIGDHLFFDLEGGGQSPGAPAQAAPAGPSEYDAFSSPVGPAGPQAVAPPGEDARLASMPWLQRTPRYVAEQEGEWFQRDDGTWEQDIPVAPEIIERDGGKYEIRGPDGGYYPATEADVRAFRQQNEDARQERIEVANRRADPTYRAARADMDAAAATGIGQARAFGQGYSYGFADELDATAQGLQTGARNFLGLNGEDPAYGMDIAAQATRDAERARAAEFARSNPGQSAGFNILGGVLAPGVRGGGNYIAGATTGAGRLGRAGQVGFLGSAAYGAGTSEGSLLERSPDALQSGLVGAGTSVAGQGAVDRLLGSQSSRLTRPASQARRLSREGVDLTPGQMAAEVPVVGGLLRNLEEGASTVPVGGAMISDARTRSVNTFNRAALNRVLEPLNQPGQAPVTMPSGLLSQVRRIGRGDANPQAGYEAVERVQGIVRQQYDAALEGIEVRPDPQFYDEIAGVLMDSGERMTPQLTEQLTNVLQNRVFRTLEASDSVMTGEAFKRAESELGALAREQRISLDPANRALAGALDDTRGVLRSLIARQRPDRAPRIQAINRAYANLVPIEEAAGSTASQATEGVFTPTTLATAASRSQTRSMRGTGHARMQDLTAPGKGLLNSRLGDSGTATRVGVTGLMSGAAGAGTLMNPAVAIPVIVGVSAAYSRPAQAVLNAVYRATDSQTASEALVELARLAQRDPALVPYYEAAAEHALQLGQTQTPASQPGLLSPPAPTPGLIAAN